MISRFKVEVVEFVNSAVGSVLAGKTPGDFRWLEILWLTGLFAGGILVYGHFFNYGNFDMLYHDWAQITGPRMQFLQTAIREGQLPLHISDAETLHFATTRYLAIADVFISPQYLLLYWLSLPVFSYVNVCLLYALGFFGLIFIKNKLRLSSISFTILFLLFNFNGGILAHFSVGHYNWAGYFLLPWFAYLVIRLLDGDRSWLWTSLMAVLLFAIWLQGDYHHFLYLLILLAFIGILVPKTFLTVLRTGVAAFVVSAFRLLPCILSYPIYIQSFLNGYPSLLSIWDNLVDLPNSLNSAFFVNSNLGTPVGEWELTGFIGLLGGIFFAYFGVYRGLIQSKAPYNRMLVPLGIMTLFSLGPVFEVLKKLPIPNSSG